MPENRARRGECSNRKGRRRACKGKINRAPSSFEGGAEPPRTLTPAQQAALASIESSDKTVQLIHGVTGSGKTEIYLNVISRALERGKTAIFLVPEISLTPQMFSQLKRRFGDKAAILHSGLSAGERFDEWWRLRTGEAKIAIGARSAIFSPLENIGAIIIDEEHDGSYFSESAPRYSTVEVAEMRARNNGCKLVLGSATPSVEAYSRAVSGEYNLITLTERINGKPLPHITIADMRKEVKRGNNSAFSQALREELSDTLQSGNQAIIFLNRRGYSHTVICQDCGYALKCEHCDVSLAYHSEENCLKCHYCGAKYRMPRACPECGGLHLRYGGTGTQRVVADLKAAFPSARILRMDNDTTSGKEGHYKILKKFGDKEADILVGTQMIAKGHDFPSVTLVGILDADMSLHFSDYRAGGAHFPAHNAGRGQKRRAGEAGKVVLQTYSARKLHTPLCGELRLPRLLQERGGAEEGYKVPALLADMQGDGHVRTRRKRVGGAQRGILRRRRTPAAAPAGIHIPQQDALADKKNTGQGALPGAYAA